MSKTYQAMNKAKAEQERQFNPSWARNGRETPDSFWDKGVPNRLEYEKIRVWLTHPTGLDQRVYAAMVVGCQSGTGTTTTASLLAATLSEAHNSRVLIVDGNFRTPALNRIFQLRNNGGFSEVMSKGLPFATHTQPTNRKNLSVLPSGQAPVVPAELFEGEAMKEFLSQLKDKFDFIIFDAAPLLQFPDAYALAPRMDGVILVVEAEKTSIEDAQRVKRNLEQVGAKILGVVLNRQRDYTPALLRNILNRAN